MANNREFIVNLVSNASMGLYPNNKIASFTTQLPGNGIQLPRHADSTADNGGGGGGGYWEVALLEISFPTRFKNVTVGEYSIMADRFQNQALRTHVSLGSHRNVESIMDEINKSSKGLYRHTFDMDVDRLFDYKQNPVTDKWEIKPNDPGAHLSLLGDDLRAILGFGYEKGVNGIAQRSKAALNNDGWVRAEYPSDIQRLHTMMVYTNIIEHQIIGDTVAPLLRVIPLTTKIKNFALSGMESSQISKVFTHPLQYKRVQVNAFHSINIDLYAENGLLIPFTGVGRTSLTLLFRYNDNNNRSGSSM